MYRIGECGVEIGNVEQPKVFLGELASNFPVRVFIYCFISAAGLRNVGEGTGGEGKTGM